MQGASPIKGRLCPNRIRLGSKSLIGGTRLQEGAGVLIKPRVDHRWRADIWTPGGVRERLYYFKFVSSSDWILAVKVGA